MNAARQQFEHGFMLWFDYDGGLIFAIADDGWWRDFPDEWDGESEPVAESPPGKIKPLRGFGDVWAKNSGVADLLGWAVAGEQSGQGECLCIETGWHVTFGDVYSAMLEFPVEPAPEPPPEPLPPPTPDDSLPLHEQANYDLILLPSADDPRIMWDVSSFLYLNLLNDGRVVGELKRPIVGVELPPEIEIDLEGGRWIVWFAGEYARGLWAHCLRVAYRPFIAVVDGWPGV